MSGFSKHRDALPLDAREATHRHAGAPADVQNAIRRYNFAKNKLYRRDYDDDGPDVRNDPKAAEEWGFYFHYLHMGLGALFVASMFIQIGLFAGTHKFNICAIATQDMLRGSPLESTFTLVGNYHIFYFTVFATFVVAAWHLYLSWSSDGFMTWYNYNVRYEQASIKFYVYAVPWALFTVVIASLVGVTNVFMLIMLAILSASGKVCIGLMERYNGRVFNTDDGNRNTLFGYLVDTVRLSDDAAVEEVDRLIYAPDAIMVPLWVCGGAWCILVATISAYFGYAMVHNSAGIHWWVAAVFGIFIALKAFEFIAAIGYWGFLAWPFRNYVYMEVAHLVLHFVVFTLITYLVLGAGGNAGYGTTDGCLYPF